MVTASSNANLGKACEISPKHGRFGREWNSPTGDKGLEVDFTLGSEVYREFVITRLEGDARIRIKPVAPVKKEKRAHSTSEGSLDIELLHKQRVMGTTALAEPTPTWEYGSKLVAHAVEPDV